MRLRRCAIAAFAFIVTSVAGAQQMPTDVELKAAYCVAVIQTVTTTANKMLDDSGVPEKARSDAFKDSNDRLNRLRLYLTPKLQALEPISVLAAMKRGEADVPNYFRRVDELRPKCTPSCPPINSYFDEQDKGLQCVKACLQGDELIARVNSCSRLDWLPF